MFRRRDSIASAPTDLACSIDQIDEAMQRLFHLVADGLAKATTAFLENDRVGAGAVVMNDTEIDSLQHEVERLVDTELARRQWLTDDELRFLIAVVRIVPELERSGDLVEHIALRTGHTILAPLTPEAIELISQMGNHATGMWRMATTAYVERDASVAEPLGSIDDELDDLHVRLTTELGTVPLPPSVAIELGLVARFLERLGDHAVNVTNRVAGLTVPNVVESIA